MNAGERIGEWTLERPLGAGGQGRVWVCVHGRTGATGALKVMRGDAEPAEESRFAREIEVLSALRHPALVALLDHGRLDGGGAGNPWMVMSYVPGETVEARLARGSVCPLAEAMPMFAALADGLRHAHELGIHHRDVKAENVIVGADGWAVLVDFGVALKQGVSRLTSAGFVMGTFAYLPPEVVTGGERDPVLADVYALGQLLCEFVTGTPCFRSLTDGKSSARWGALIAAKASTGPLDPGEGFPEPFRELVRRATAPEPEDRTRTIGELADGLRALLDPASEAALEARLGASWGPTPGAPTPRAARPKRSSASPRCRSKWRCGKGPTRFQRRSRRRSRPTR
ncbi:MAG: serine/threonine-protein kinase, partial [Myxococcota bacterium]